MTRRVVTVTDLCEHGYAQNHTLLPHPPHALDAPCPGGSRRVLIEGEFVLVEKVDGEWPEDALDRGRKQPKPGVPNFQWRRSTVADILDALAGGSS